MRVDDVRYAKTHLFPRLFAVELGITDFARDLSEPEIAVLLCVEHLDSHGVEVADIAGVMRWISQHISKIDLYHALDLITLLDYRDVVCSFIKDTGYVLGKGVVPLYPDITAKPPRSVSTAFSLTGVMVRWKRATTAAAPTPAQARDSGSGAAASAQPSAP